MKRISADYEEESETLITGKDGFVHIRFIVLENTHDESCIVDIDLVLKTLQADKNHPHQKEAKDSFLVLDNKDLQVEKIFKEKFNNNDVTTRYFELLKEHEVKTSLLLPREKKELELFFDGKKFKHDFLLDISVTCTFEDKHTEKFEMNISIL